MKQRIIIILAVLFSLVPMSDFSQAEGPSVKFPINATFNPVGSGARAMGMGGAFIAVADDATAASWNPAGLIQLETPEISLVGSYLNIREKFESSAHDVSNTCDKRSYDLNYLSFAYPFKFLERNMVVSLNYQRLYDMYKNSSIDGTQPLFIGGNSKVTEKYKLDGGIKALAPALAIQVTPWLSLGITFNIWTDNLLWENGWTMRYWFKNKRPGYLDKLHTYQKFSSFEGFNSNIGFLWDINSFLTIGGVIKTPFTADLHHQYKSHSVYITPDGTTDNTLKFSEHVELSMPMSYGLGFSFRLSDALTTSLDVYRTQWSKFFLRDGNGDQVNPITGIERSYSHMHDTTQVRAGIEYLIIKEKTVIPLRAGVFYDPQPSEKHPDDFFGFSLGTGITISNIILDCAYVFRYGNNVRGDGLRWDIEEDEIQHTVLMSIIYHFDR